MEEQPFFNGKPYIRQSLRHLYNVMIWYYVIQYHDYIDNSNSRFTIVFEIKFHGLTEIPSWEIIVYITSATRALATLFLNQEI